MSKNNYLKKMSFCKFKFIKSVWMLCRDVQLVKNFGIIDKEYLKQREKVHSEIVLFFNFFLILEH